MAKVFQILLCVVMVAGVILGVLAQWYPHFQNPFRVLLGIVMVLTGITSLLGIWLPSFRAKWKGSKVDCGLLSCASMAFFMFIIGCFMLFATAISKQPGPWLLVGAMVFWILGCVGYSLDVRRWKRSVTSTRPLNSMPAAMPDERHGWEFAALGSSFLVVIIWLFASSK
jgi:hypothetical protein